MLLEKEHPRLSVVRQCELLSISRSGLYYEPVKQSEEHLAIMRFLDEQYLKTPFYGLERLLILLVLAGYHVNCKRLRRLMKLQGWQTLYPVPPAQTRRQISILICSGSSQLSGKTS